MGHPGAHYSTAHHKQQQTTSSTGLASTSPCLLTLLFSLMHMHMPCVLQDLSSSALAEFKKDPWQWQRQRMVLPEVTLAGPVELVFSRITDLSLYLPHSTDVPRARRLLVAPGAALTLRQLKGISLRKPVELPDLPAAYIAEVRLRQLHTGAKHSTAVASSPRLCLLAHVCAACSARNAGACTARCLCATKQGAGS